MYLFTENDKVEQDVLSQLSFGGGCINDTIIHLATPYLGLEELGIAEWGHIMGRKCLIHLRHEKSIHKEIR